MADTNFIDNFAKSPLSNEDINLIGSINLSLVEKHHLRMLAHCLECFKSMRRENKEGLVPRKEIWLEWCLEHPMMLKDDEFVQILFEQLSGAAIQLERLATSLKVAPLDLTLKDLINAYQA
tara:strand:+ start:1469 stop:1831 length:363 start_codon:yes stop_codon:yes gene_type:complete